MQHATEKKKILNFFFIIFSLMKIIKKGLLDTAILSVNLDENV